VVIESYNFKASAKYKPQPIPESKVTWADNIPRSATSGDGVDLVHYLPRLVKDAGVVSASSEKIPNVANLCQATLTKVILDYTEIVKPQVGKSATSADKAGVYVDRDGELMGEIRCVRHWHAIGQPVSLEFSLSVS
jgi:hypothetical protein